MAKSFSSSCSWRLSSGKKPSSWTELFQNFILKQDVSFLLSYVLHLKQISIPLRYGHNFNILIFNIFD